MIDNNLSQEELNNLLISLSNSTQNNVPYIEEVLQKGANIEFQNEEGNTALCFACIKGNLTIVNFLINKGANINHRNKTGKTPLMLTIIHKPKNTN